MKKKLKEICSKIHRGKTPKYIDSSDVLVFAQKCNLQTGGIDLNKCLCLDTKNIQKWQKEDYLFREDILINSTGIGTLGRVGYFDTFSEKPVVPDTHVTVVRVSDSNVYSKWVYYCLKNKQDFLISKGHGSTKQQELATSEIEKIEIPCPDLLFQKRSVNFLDTIQSAIDNKKQQLALLDEAVKSKFIEMFGENPVENGKWKVEKLGDCGTFKNGMNYSPNENGVDILCLNVSDFKDNYKIQDCKTLSSISLNEEPSSEYYLQNDDIVFVRSNGNKKLVGRCVALYPNDCKVLFSGFCIRFRKSTDNLNTDFLLHFLKTDLTREHLKGKGANIQNLNQQILANLHLPVPPLDLQNQFASFVQQIDKSKSLVKQQITDLQELLDSKMQEYFG